ncbi:helix-turn-helix domain-containing protein [Williamsia herbipolensis]|uniref:helix-turn-helix domain-containing protein n=1 Tax=Williamsia herbipolensis TaxID=1603258 RepID=UPI0005F8946D|nr:helix-turn-helix domain-containing protein [Williamsia herbipolensis]
MTDELPKLLYTLAEAARATGLSERTLMREKADHKLVAVKVRDSKRIYFTAKELERWAGDLEEV